MFVTPLASGMAACWTPFGAKARNRANITAALTSYRVSCSNRRGPGLELLSGPLAGSSQKQVLGSLALARRPDLFLAPSTDSVRHSSIYKKLTIWN
jgi:hypothetical protein